MSAMQARQSEIAQYCREYESPGYRMGEQRRADVERLLRTVRVGTLLDIGTGRGETLEIATRLGFLLPRGTEVVPDLLDERVVYAEAHALPHDSASFDVVTCFDVLEHLLSVDLIDAVSEMSRVAKHHIIVSASEVPSVWNGRELHISRRPADEWEYLFREAAPGWEFIRMGEAGGSPAWVASK